MRTFFAISTLFVLASGCGVDPKTDIEPQAWWQQQLTAKGPPKLDRERELKLWSKFLARGLVHQATRTGYPNGIIGGPQWVRAEREYCFKSECGHITMGHRTAMYKQSERIYGVMYRDDAKSGPAEPQFVIHLEVDWRLYDFHADKGTVLAVPLDWQRDSSYGYFIQLYLRWRDEPPDPKLLRLETAYEQALDCFERE